MDNNLCARVYAHEDPQPKLKPHIVRNNHKHINYLWRCFIGRYSGYADTIEKAYLACINCFGNGKYWESDIKHNPQLLVMYSQHKKDT